jgi:hypothetical protein
MSKQATNISFKRIWAIVPTSKCEKERNCSSHKGCWTMQVFCKQRPKTKLSVFEKCEILPPCNRSERSYENRVPENVKKVVFAVELTEMYYQKNHMKRVTFNPYVKVIQT